MVFRGAVFACKLRRGVGGAKVMLSQASSAEYEMRPEAFAAVMVQGINHVASRLMQRELVNTVEDVQTMLSR